MHWSPLAKAAVDERIDEMTSGEAAYAATEAQRHIKVSEKMPDIDDAFEETRRWAFRVLCGVRLNEVATAQDGRGRPATVQRRSAGP